MISGGAECASDMYEWEGRADWSQPMPLVLDKLGYLERIYAAVAWRGGWDDGG